MSQVREALSNKASLVFELEAGGSREPWKEIRSREGFRKMAMGAGVGRGSRAGRGRLGGVYVVWPGLNQTLGAS